MTDKEILEEVYRRLKETTSNGFEVNSFTAVTSFIEQEWQKRDDLETWRNEIFNLADDGQKYNTNSVDATEIERHVGLEIGEDGTVTGIK